MVADMNFMKKFMKILDASAPRTLANYMQWTLIREWLQPNSTLASHADLNSAVGTGEGQDTSGEDW